MVQRAREKAPWIKILERDQICNLFWGNGCLRAINALWTHRCPWIWVISSCAKDMAKLMGWSTPADLGLGAVTSWILVMTSWTKQEGRGRRSKQIPRQNVRWRGWIAIFELTFSIKRPWLQRRGWDWPQSIKGLIFSFLHTRHNTLLYATNPMFC
jgi:hypothetical protein